MFEFINALHCKESQILKEFGKFKVSLESKSTLTNTNLWLQVAQSNQKDHASWVSVLNVLVQDINKLRSELKKRLKNYVNDTNRWTSLIKKDRNSILLLIKKQKLCSANVADSQSLDDPWLSQRELTNQLLDMTTKENQFQKRIVFVFDDILKFDQYLMIETQRIYDTYLTEQGLHFSRILVILLIKDRVIVHLQYFVILLLLNSQTLMLYLTISYGLLIVI